MDRKWTPELSEQWQQYYNTAPRLAISIQGGQFYAENLDTLPKYKDFDPVICQKERISNNANFVYQNPFIILLFFIILIFVA
jgi:hypothetical protein